MKPTMEDEGTVQATMCSVHALCGICGQIHNTGMRVSIEQSVCHRLKDGRMSLTDLFGDTEASSSVEKLPGRLFSCPDTAGNPQTSQEDRSQIFLESLSSSG